MDGVHLDTSTNGLVHSQQLSDGLVEEGAVKGLVQISDDAINLGDVENFGEFDVAGETLEVLGVVWEIFTTEGNQDGVFESEREQNNEKMTSIYKQQLLALLPTIHYIFL